MRPLGHDLCNAHASNGISLRSQHNPHHSSFASNLARGATCYPGPYFLEHGIGGQNPRTRWSRICVTPLQDGKNAVLREQLVEGEVGFLVPLLDFQAIFLAIRGFGFPCSDAIACFGQDLSTRIHNSSHRNELIVTSQSYGGRKRLLAGFPKSLLRRDTIETIFFRKQKVSLSSVPCTWEKNQKRKAMKGKKFIRSVVRQV